uniref:Ovomucoid n=1 Tax=Geospiza parvula TaxID=87175 RepID=A0A8U8B1N3_GEOPR
MLPFSDVSVKVPEFGIWSFHRVVLTTSRCLYLFDSELPSLQVDCSEYEKLESGRPIYCERLYQPYCGSDGKTYNNKCSFCKAVLRSRGALHMKQAGAC